MTEDIRARTHFFHSNLLHVDSAPFADFNIIFCQNVLIYFERERQRWIIDQLVDRLRVGGLLVLGAGEDVSWLNQSVRRLRGRAYVPIRKLEVERVNKKPDIVSLKWVIGLINAQADAAEVALVEYGTRSCPEAGAAALHVVGAPDHLHAAGAGDEKGGDADAGNGAQPQFSVQGQSGR